MDLYGYETGFDMFSIMFFIVFALIVGTIIINAIKGISEWSNRQGYTLYFLNIFCKDSNRKWKKKASIYLGNKVLLKVEEDTDYYLVAIGHLDFSKGFPPKLKLASRQAFSIEKVL